MSIRIAVSMRVVKAFDYDEPRDAISHDWIRFFEKNNWDFILVTNCMNNVCRYLDDLKVNSILLSNGNDVIELKSEFLSLGQSIERDKTEKAMLNWAIESNLPVLGVCRGLHLVNVYFGGSIKYNLKNSKGYKVNHIAKTHLIEIIDPTTQEFFSTNSAMVNSYHEHGVTEEKLAKKLIPFAITSDRIIEGFYLRDKPILAIQWHPERQLENNPINNDLPVRFINDGPWWI